jgi:hypothetical protein
VRRRAVCTAANALWLASCAGEAARFRRATRRVATEQAQVLFRILRANAATAFGRGHAFSGIRTVRDFQHRVPVRAYEDFRPWIDRVADGSVNVLTRSPVRMFEPTSGSDGPSKLIPYTAPLALEFQRGIRPWIADLFAHDPRLMSGTAYWSVSPGACGRRTTAGGIRVGFDDDTEYLGGVERRLAGCVMAAPAALGRVADVDRWRYLTLLALVSSAALRIISVWHPSFLSLLLARMEDWGDAILRDLRGDPGRARDVRRALSAASAGERHARLWPKLRLVSCWADGNAAAPAAAIRDWFPQARLQPKGLVATEGIISIPMTGEEGSLLAVRSHFLEFEPLESGARSGAPRLSGELEAGGRYAVVLTTGGGLYRYRMHDVVDVVGHVNECPVIRFVGRGESVSDWFGEKLTDAFAGEVIRSACRRHGIAAAFAMLACEPVPGPARYVLYVEAAATDAELEALADTIDRGLRRSFHYDYARRLGQLAAVRPFRTRGAPAAYLLAAVRESRRPGSVKPPALDRRSGWRQIFEGEVAASRIIS